MSDEQGHVTTGGNGAGGSRAGSAAELEGFLPQSARALVVQETRAREFIRSHPIPVVLGALVLGFAVARWLQEE